MRKALIAVAVTALAVTGLAAPSSAVVGTPASDAGIVPEFIDGNPTCSSIRPDLIELKVDNGTGGSQTDGYTTVEYTTPDGKEVNWTADRGIDLVVVKGGPNGNSYLYDPPEELLADGGLYAPINPSNGDPYGISHVSFCIDYEVTATKTAATTFTRTFDWDITKEALNDLDLFRGDSGDIDWEVAVTKSEPVDSDWAVSGDITVLNDTPLQATITDVTDEISGFGDVAVDCPQLPTPVILGPGQSLLCTYETDLPDGTDRTNTATVTTTGAVGGDTATAAVNFGDPTTVVGDSIDVSDTNGQSWSTGESTSWAYSTPHECGTEDGEGYDVPNTATIEGGASAEDTARVNCYDLAVTKDAFTSYTRTWDWTVNKSADQTDLILSEGQVFDVNYDVSVSAIAEDSDFRVFSDEGIKVYNPAPVAVDLTSVTDVFEGEALDVDCGVTFPYTLAAGDTLVCTYDAAVASDADGTNTATATTEFGVDYSGTADVNFGSAVVTQVDQCVNLTDDRYPGLAEELCANGALRAFPVTTREYAQPMPSEECGPRTYTNTARIVTNTRSIIDESPWDVRILVPCDTGCTLTLGYWKTHSEVGPAPYDEGWLEIGDVDGDGTVEQQNEMFFGSGKTWLEVFRTPPAGNAYYNLAHQYMAAVLNIANGASSTSAVDAAIAGAAALFGAQGVNDVTLSRAERTAALGYATTLDQYNNGLIGPGHCSEQPA
jgi:hypothetical protein